MASKGVEATRGVVLVVDDDPEVRSAVAALIAPRYKVIEAGDAETGHALAIERQPDAVLMDVSLPRMDGPTALLRWHADERTAAIPVLMFTGSRADEDTQVVCLSRGAADFLQKPVSRRLLLARLDRAVRDRVERQRLEAAAQTDALTGLPNFRALDIRLRQELERARRYRHPLALAMIDLDHLKGINDRFGHMVGNQVLESFALRLTHSLRGTDFAARYGGDEFAVILAHQSWREAVVFCERLRTSLLTSPLRAADGQRMDLGTTISVGVAAHAPSAPRASMDLLVSAADAALYEAKRRGRNQVVVHERDLDSAENFAGSEDAAREH